MIAGLSNKVSFFIKHFIDLCVEIGRLVNEFFKGLGRTIGYWWLNIKGAAHKCFKILGKEFSIFVRLLSYYLRCHFEEYAGLYLFFIYSTIAAVPFILAMVMVFPNLLMPLLPVYYLISFIMFLLSYPESEGSYIFMYLLGIIFLLIFHAISHSMLLLKLAGLFEIAFIFVVLLGVFYYTFTEMGFRNLNAIVLSLLSSIYIVWIPIAGLFFAPYFITLANIWLAVTIAIACTKLAMLLYPYVTHFISELINDNVVIDCFLAAYKALGEYCRTLYDFMPSVNLRDSVEKIYALFSKCKDWFFGLFISKSEDGMPVKDQEEPAIKLFLRGANIAPLKARPVGEIQLLPDSSLKV